MKSSTLKKIHNIILYSIAILLCIAFIIPFYFIIVNSLKGLYDAPSTMIQGFHFDNYRLAITLIPFFQELKNTLILIVFEMVPSFISNLLIGFAFARLKAPGKNFLFMLVLSTLILPYVAIQIPQFILFNKIGLTNTYWLWAINAIGGNSMFIFLYRQFFAGIPKELEESAKIDGSSVIGMLFRIFIPIAIPVIVIVTFQDFLWVWSDYMTPFMYLHTEKYPLAAALFGSNYYIDGSPGIQVDSLIDAASVLLIIPVFVAFIFTQSYLVEGIATTGIKG